MSILRPAASKIFLRISNRQQAAALSTTSGYHSTNYEGTNDYTAQRPKRSIPQYLRRDAGIRKVGCIPLPMRTDNNGFSIASSRSSKRLSPPNKSPTQTHSATERHPSVGPCLGESDFMNKKRRAAVRPTPPANPKELLRALRVARRDAQLETERRRLDMEVEIKLKKFKNSQKRIENVSPVLLSTGLVPSMTTVRTMTMSAPRPLDLSLLVEAEAKRQMMPLVRMMPRPIFPKYEPSVSEIINTSILQTNQRRKPRMKNIKKSFGPSTSPLLEAKTR